MNNIVPIRELAAWGFDPYPHRPQLPAQIKAQHATAHLAARPPGEPADALLASEPESFRDLFAPHVLREDLLEEMHGLSWAFGMVDLRRLIAFQRRLAFNPDIAPPAVPASHDWPALFAFCFGPAKAIAYEASRDASSGTLTLRSEDPNLHLRITSDAACPLRVHAGSPFFEVACYRHRWFLRDGYHRAYALLQAGIDTAPALIVAARTLAELGANRPWFFPEEVLFSSTPPFVADFLNDHLVLDYGRPPLLKVLRIKMEEALQPATFTGEQR